MTFKPGNEHCTYTSNPDARDLKDTIYIPTSAKIDTKVKKKKKVLS